MGFDAITDEKYHCLYKYTHPLQVPNRKMVGREKEMRQIRAAMNRPELCNVLLLAEAGAGKAVANGTLVPVADGRGYVPVEEIQVGDKVFDEHGKPVDVMGVFPQGRLHAYEVVFRDLTSVVCNDEHFWRVSFEGGPWTTRTLNEILDRGISGLNGTPRWAVPMAGAVEREEVTLSPGPWVNEDGSLPDEAFICSIDQRKAYLRELLGQYGKPIDEWFGFRSRRDMFGPEILVCHSERLVSDVRKLAASLGRKTEVMDNKLELMPGEDELTYAVAFIKDAEWERGQEIIMVHDAHSNVEMTCLYVDSESHCFQVTEHHIVTHNTMLVQSTMQNDPGKLYLEVDLSKMVANCSTDVNQMAAKLKSLFDDVARYVKDEKQEVVLFMDEFHQVVQLSDAAVEALKPLLADSGVRGIRVITATTPVEFRRHISPNQPLVERLQRINLAQTDKETTIAILKGMAQRYGVADQIYNDAIYESIYEYTNRYIPANAQPRKSILIMDAMIGWHRAEGRKIDKYLLADVIYESEGVNVAFKVDASKIKARLDKKVLSQKFATKVIEQRLQLCVADLNNKSRPMSSFLFSGSSGSGKATTCDTPIPIYSDDSQALFRPAGDVKVGDYVFDREGRKTEVLGVFPQGRRTVYRVQLEDGRHLDVSDNHLWAVYVDDDEEYVIRTTKEMFDSLGTRFSIPVEAPVHWSDLQFNRVLSADEFDDDAKLATKYAFEKQGITRVPIKGIQCLDEEKDMVCFYVDNEEHLYQAGEFVVTHNTEMVKSLAQILFDDDRSLLRFDCTEFANADSLERFRRELTARVWEHPHSIILLDEIEKACSPVTRLLLQVLDDGRLIDENNREVSFINSYIVMTTNAGSEIYRTIAQYAADDDGSGKSMSRYDKLIRNSISTTTGDNRFPPELLGRIDCIVPFQPLSEETMKAIARMKLQQMRREILQRHGIKVMIQENVIRYLVEDNLDTDADSGGARTVVSKMESEVTTKIAKFINENPGIYKIRVSVEGTLAADDVNKLLSDAYIKVEAAL